MSTGSVSLVNGNLMEIRIRLLVNSGTSSSSRKTKVGTWSRHIPPWIEAEPYFLNVAQCTEFIQDCRRSRFWAQLSLYVLVRPDTSLLTLLFSTSDSCCKTTRRRILSLEALPVRVLSASATRRMATGKPDAGSPENYKSGCPSSLRIKQWFITGLPRWEKGVGGDFRPPRVHVFPISVQWTRYNNKMNAISKNKMHGLGRHKCNMTSQKWRDSKSDP